MPASLVRNAKTASGSRATSMSWSSSKPPSGTDGGRNRDVGASSEADAEEHPGRAVARQHPEPQQLLAAAANESEHRGRKEQRRSEHEGSHGPTDGPRQARTHPDRTEHDQRQGRRAGIARHGEEARRRDEGAKGPDGSEVFDVTIDEA